MTGLYWWSMANHDHSIHTYGSVMGYGIKPPEWLSFGSFEYKHHPVFFDLGGHKGWILGTGSIADWGVASYWSNCDSWKIPLGGELPTNRVGEITLVIYKWTTCPQKNPMKKTRLVSPTRFVGSSPQSTQEMGWRLGPYDDETESTSHFDSRDESRVMIYLR